MRTGLADGAVLLHLPGQGASKVHCARPGFVCLEPEHAGARQFVVSTAAGTLLLHLDNVDGVPAALDLLRVSVPGLLDQDDT